MKAKQRFPRPIFFLVIWALTLLGTLCAVGHPTPGLILLAVSDVAISCSATVAALRKAR